LKPSKHRLSTQASKAIRTTRRHAPSRTSAVEGWNALRGDLPFPVALLKESALAHNLEWMADFTRATGVLLAPHGKTTMAPQALRAADRVGRLGNHVRDDAAGESRRAHGASGRIIVANQLVGRAGHRAGVRAARNGTADLELHFLVDSILQLSLIEAEDAAARTDGAR
jgi:D-serine dehydratase